MPHRCRRIGHAGLAGAVCEHGRYLGTGAWSTLSHLSDVDLNVVEELATVPLATTLAAIGRAIAFSRHRCPQCCASRFLRWVPGLVPLGCASLHSPGTRDGAQVRSFASRTSERKARAKIRQLLYGLGRHVGFAVTHDRVEGGQELSGDGDKGELGGLAGVS